MDIVFSISFQHDLRNLIDLKRVLQRSKRSGWGKQFLLSLRYLKESQIYQSFLTVLWQRLHCG